MRWLHIPVSKSLVASMLCGWGSAMIINCTTKQSCFCHSQSSQHQSFMLYSSCYIPSNPSTVKATLQFELTYLRFEKICNGRLKSNVPCHFDDVFQLRQYLDWQAELLTVNQLALLLHISWQHDHVAFSSAENFSLKTCSTLQANCWAFYRRELSGPILPTFTSRGDTYIRQTWTRITQSASQATLVVQIQRCHTLSTL